MVGCQPVNHRKLEPCEPSKFREPEDPEGYVRVRLDSGELKARLDVLSEQ